MTETRPTSTTDLVAHRASGYDWTGTEFANSENWLTLSPSGAYLSTVLDMAIWDAALTQGQVIKKSLRDSMWQPMRLNDGTISPYGFGWQLDPWQGHRRVHHDGELPGFEADYERFLDTGLSVILLCNGADVDAEGMALRVAGYYQPDLVPKKIEDREPLITEMVRRTVAGFVSGNFDESNLSLELSKELAGDGKDFLAGILREPGPVRSIYLVDKYDLGGQHCYRYRVTYPDDSVLLLFTLDKAGKVTRIVPNVG